MISLFCELVVEAVPPLGASEGGGRGSEENQCEIKSRVGLLHFSIVCLFKKG